MRKILAAGAALVLAGGLATSASAAQVFQGGYVVSAFTTGGNNNNGLDINIHHGSGNFSTSSLAIGGSYTDTDLFEISADEQINAPSSGSDGDTNPKPITVQFTFTQPNLPGSGPDATDSGFTVAVNGTPDFGQLTWGAPATVDFVGVGLLTITMQNVTFFHGGEECDDGSSCAHVGATFSLAAEPTQTGGVPEPASWALMIGGFGMTGAALRRRRTAVAATA